MALPISKTQLIDYCKRQCGEPVIRVNMAPSQFDDCIDRALLFWQDYNESAQERFYIKYDVTATDIANGYLSLPTYVQAVLRVVDTKGLGAGFSWMSYEYSLVRDAIFDAAKASGLSNYVITRTYLAELDFQLNPAPPFHFNFNSGALRIDGMLGNYIKAGDSIAVEVMGWLDVNQYNRIWHDKNLMALAVGEVKKQFGWNLKKYGNVTLPSGITLDGQAFYDEGVAEIEEAKQNILDYQMPLGIIIG